MPDPVASRPRLSVVIPACDEERLLPDTLVAVRDGFAAIGLEPGRFEVVVCDNDSTDATARIAAYAGALVVHEPRRQIARARNSGAAAARGEWLLFLDADSPPGRGLLEDLLGAIDEGTVVGGGATLRMALPLALRPGLGLWNLLSRSCGWAAGAFLYCRADAFREVGGFSEMLYAGEEVDLSRRLGRWGRARGLRFRVLSRHPLETSARKIDLYGPSDIARVLWLMVRHPWRFFRDPRLCFPWYDGRR